MKHSYFKIASLLLMSVLLSVASVHAQKNDATAPLHLLQPDYPTPYGVPQKDSINKVLNRVYQFLDANTASKIINATTKAEITNYKKGNEDIVFAPGAFRLTSYEWGVTYAGMLLATKATGNP